MPRIEFQISTPVLFEALTQILEQRLYALCFVSPVMGLCLDHVEAGVVGPITQPSNLVPASLNLAISVMVFVATAEAVQAAQGGAPAISVKPGGVPVTANFVLSIRGTKLTAKYDGIVQNDSYNSLQDLLAGSVGGAANAKQLFSRWETALKTALAAISLLDFDLKDILPPQVQGLSIGRSALCGDSEIFAARLEAGANGSDGSWQDFEKGSPGNLIGSRAWGLFISGDVLVGVVNNLVKELVAKAAPQYPAVIQGVFSLLAESGPLTYSPLDSVAPATASVATSATIDFSVAVSLLGLTVGRDQVSIELISILIFTVDGPFLNISLYWAVQQQDNTSDILGGLVAYIVDQVTQPLDATSLPSGFASGFSATDAPNFFISQTALPPVAVENLLILTVSGCTGTVEPPVSSSVQQQIDSLSTPLPFFQIFPPGSGLLIFGEAAIATGKSLPDCGVRSTPFALVINEVVNGGSWTPVTPANVPAIGTFSVYNKAHASTSYPLIVGALIPFPDPAAQWFQSPSLLPKVPFKAGKVVVTVPEAQFRAEYLEAPYPMSLIVCTNGGARFVSLGAIPTPKIDPSTGLVLNANELTTVATPSTTPSSGPHHPLTEASNDE